MSKVDINKINQNTNVNGFEKLTSLLIAICYSIITNVYSCDFCYENLHTVRIFLFDGFARVALQFFNSKLLNKGHAPLISTINGVFSSAFSAWQYFSVLSEVQQFDKKMLT